MPRDGRDTRRLGGTLAALGLAAWPALAAAEVATDGTLGPKARLRGRDVTVAAGLGRIKGRNLFHSFERLDVEAGGRVTLAGPPDGRALDNVVSRVTGGRASSIDGTLASTVPGADVYLVNPAGVVFGPGARLEVPASFHVSTADELRFKDGAVFSARDPGGSTLSVAAPESFGFLGGRPAAITLDRARLAVPAGETFSLAGGDIPMTAGNAGPASTLDPASANVRAERGRIAVAAMGGPGRVDIASGEAAGTVSGDLRMVEEASVNVAGDGGGTVVIRAGRLSMEGASILNASNLGPTDSRGGASVRADIVTIGSESRISDIAESTGRAGTTTVEARAVELRTGGRIRGTTIGAGEGGTVRVVAGRLLVDGEGVSDVETGVLSDAFGVGNAGRVEIEAGEVEVRSGGLIRSVTAAAGEAGSVDVKAGRLLVSGEGSAFATGILGGGAGPGFGGGGVVTVGAEEVELRAGGVIRNVTFGDRDAGPVRVRVAGRLLIDATGAHPDAVTGLTSDADGEGSGNAGALTVEAGDVEIRRGGVIRSITFAAGDAGSVDVKAGRLVIAGDETLVTGILSDALEGSSGDAGNVTVNARELEIRPLGEIKSDTRSRGDAGSVTVTATERLLIDGGGASQLFTGVSSDTFEGTLGNAGPVAVSAGRLEVRRDGAISSTALGRGAAGDVRVEAGTLLVDDSGIRTEAAGAEGGRIRISASGLIALDRAEITSNGIQPRPGASLITLEAPVIAVNASRVTSLTGAGEPIEGSGVVRLLGGVTVVSADSLVAASSSVETTGLQADLGSRLQVSAGAFLDAGRLLGQGCAARRAGGKASSFTREGRGGLPPSPDRPLAAASGRERLRPGGVLQADAGCGPVRG